jgi:hypothetical protein
LFTFSQLHAELCATLARGGIQYTAFHGEKMKRNLLTSLAVMAAICALAAPSSGQIPNSGAASGGIRSISPYVAGSSDCGIQEAYNAAPPTGAYLLFDVASCNITSPQTITLTSKPAAKPLFIEGAGATIYMSHRRGVGLHFRVPTTNSPVWEIRNLHFIYTGSGSGVYGVELDMMDYGTTSKLQFFNFNMPGSYALWLHDTEQDTFIDTDIEYGCASGDCAGQGNGLYTDGAADANTMIGLHINNVHTAIAMYGGGIAFYNLTVQGAHATHPIVIDQTTGPVGFSLSGQSHFEANGDGTPATSLFYVNMAGYPLISFNINDASINQHPGYIFQFAGIGHVISANLTGNQFLNPGSQGFCTGAQCNDDGITYSGNNGPYVGKAIGSAISGKGAPGAGFAGRQFTSLTANPATSGVLNLANSDKVCWNGGAGGSDTCIRADGAGNLEIGAVGLNKAGGLTVNSGVTRIPGIISSGDRFKASGCGASEAVGGATAGKFRSGTSGTCTVTITMGAAQTAPHGWSCWANDLTTPGALIHQMGESPSTAVLSGTTAAGDTINFGCTGY